MESLILMKLKRGDTDDLDPLIEVVETTPAEMMETIVETLNLTPEQVGGTLTCWEMADEVYQICHVSQGEDGPEEDPDELNLLASQLVGGEIPVYGEALLLKSRIDENGRGAATSVTREEVSRLFEFRMRHTAVRVPEDGDLEEQKFEKDPAELFDQPDKWTAHELSIFGMTLFIFIRREPDEKVNRRITRLIGDYRVNGEAWVVRRISEHNYGEMTIDLFEQLHRCSFGSLKKRELTESEAQHGQRVDGFPVVYPPTRVVARRSDQYTSCCDYCGSDESTTVCTGCYRMRYHRRECQAADWPQHRNSCLQGQTTLNHRLDLLLKKQTETSNPTSGEEADQEESANQ